MVFHHRCHDDVVRLKAQAVREVVDRLRGVANENDHVVSTRAIRELKDALPRELVGSR